MAQQPAKAGVAAWEAELEEHKALTRLIAQIETDLARLSKGSDPELTRKLIDELTRLRGRLESHFAEEVAPEGLYADLKKALPRHIPHLVALKAEHDDLLADLADGCAGLRSAGVLIPGEVCDRLRRFLRRLTRHEARENEYLFEAAGGRDLGGG